MPRVKLLVQMLAHTPNPESVVAMSAKLCYSGADVSQLQQQADRQNNAIFLQKLVDMGHLSPIEHVSFTFGVQGVSRTLLAQLTRHRLASFSVQSQRYVNQTQGGISYVLPPAIEQLGEGAVNKFATQMDMMRQWYEEWVELLGTGEQGNEDARFVLPNAAETRLTMTMNARELMHFLRVRCCMRAQWEIRAMAWAVLGHCLSVAPNLFALTGPACVTACTEGKMSCNLQDAVNNRLEALREFVAEHGQDSDFAYRISEWAAANTRNLVVANEKE